MAFETLWVKIKADAADYDRKMQGVGRSMASIAAKATAVTAAVGAAAYGFDRFIGAGQRAAGVSRAFERATAGQANALRRLEGAVAGTVSRQELMTQFNRALALGAVRNAEEFANLASTARSLGRALGQDTASAVESLSIGIGRQSRLILDNLGIIVSAEQANEDYARSIGKAVSQLTDAERKEAFRAAALQQAQEKVEALGGSTDTAADAWQRMTVQIQNAITEVQRFVAESDGLRAFLDGFSDTIRNLSDFRAAQSMGISVGEYRDRQDRYNALAGPIGGMNLAQTRRMIGTYTTQLGGMGIADPNRAIVGRLLNALEAHERALIATARRIANERAAATALVNGLSVNFRGAPPLGADGMPRPGDLFAGGSVWGGRNPNGGSRGAGGSGGSGQPGFMDNVKETFRSAFDPENLGLGIAQSLASGGVGFITGAVSAAFGDLFNPMKDLENAIRQNTRVLNFISDERLGSELQAAGLSGLARDTIPELRRFIEDLILNPPNTLGESVGLLQSDLFQDLRTLASVLGIDLQGLNPDVLSQLLNALESATGGLENLNDAANSVAGALLNVPTGFRAALARFQASDPDSGIIPPPRSDPGAGPSGGFGPGPRFQPNGPEIMVNNLYIQASTAAIADDLQTEILRASGRGTTLLEPSVRR